MQGVTVRHSSQQFRSLLASIEILAAAAVSNALVLGSFMRDRGAKKQRFKFGSVGGHSSLDRTTTGPRRAITMRNWGSDADLVGDVGMRLDPELTEKPLAGQRPAPKASSASPKTDSVARDAVDQNWAFPNRASYETGHTDSESSKPVQEVQQPSPGDVPRTPHGASFFDVGGLLGNIDSSYPRSQLPSTAAAQPESTGSLQPSTGLDLAAGARRGSHALLQDIGGLLPPPSYATTSRAADACLESDSQHSGLIEALQSAPPRTTSRSSARSQRQRRRSLGLQDVGGLLV